MAPEDCTGCELCVNACPAFAKDADGNKTERKAINMALQAPLRETEARNWDFFLNKLPETDQSLINIETVKGSQFVKPLFEFSGACAGCGETPYVKLMTQLFGDRALCANATGCCSIYGGNLPTTPYCQNRRRSRPGLVEFAVRGQRRVRLRDAADGRQAQRIRARAHQGAGAASVRGTAEGRPEDPGGRRVEQRNGWSN